MGCIPQAAVGACVHSHLSLPSVKSTSCARSSVTPPNSIPVCRGCTPPGAHCHFLLNPPSLPCLLLPFQGTVVSALAKHVQASCWGFTAGMVMSCGPLPSQRVSPHSTCSLGAPPTTCRRRPNCSRCTAPKPQAPTASWMPIPAEKSALALWNFQCLRCRT